MQIQAKPWEAEHICSQGFSGSQVSSLTSLLPLGLSLTFSRAPKSDSRQLLTGDEKTKYGK